MLQINVKYLNSDMPAMHSYGDWIDACAVHASVNGQVCCWHMVDGQECLDFEALDVIKVGLGFSAEFPSLFEAHVRPRSSLFKHLGLIMTNGLGVIDHTYCGDGDEWFAEFLAIYPGRLWRFERICQWRLMFRMMPVSLCPVSSLGNPDRGGHGSTGRTNVFSYQEDDGYQD
ncbi:MAG: dUTP diphosphatase [Desulfohalobiaceae bacterium]